MNNGADGYEVGDFSQKKVNSVLASADFGFERKFYGRDWPNDWSSTAGATATTSPSATA